MSDSRATTLPDLDGLWNYGDPDASEAAFRSVLPAAEAAGNPGYLATLWSQIARTHGMRRDFGQAFALLDRADEVVAGLGESSGPNSATDGQSASNLALERAQGWIAIERGRTMNSSGDPAGALPFFHEARERGERAADAGLVVDALHMLAIADEGKDLEWNEEALSAARAATDPRARRWLGSLLNNQGWSYHGRGEFDRALALFEEARDYRLSQDQPKEVRVMRWCIARTWRSLGRLVEALAEQRLLAAEGRAAGDDIGYCDEEIAECLHALGRNDEARPHFAAAHAQLSQDAWLVAQEAERLARLAQMGGVDEAAT